MNLTAREAILAASPFIAFTLWTLWRPVPSQPSSTPAEPLDEVSAPSCPSSGVFSRPSKGLPRVALRWQGGRLDVESTVELRGTGCDSRCEIEARFDEGPVETFLVREVDLTRLEVVQSDWFTSSFRRSQRVDLVLEVDGDLQRASFNTVDLETP